MGVAIRMACLEALAFGLINREGKDSKDKAQGIS